MPYSAYRWMADCEEGDGGGDGGDGVCGQVSSAR